MYTAAQDRIDRTCKTRKENENFTFLIFLMVLALQTWWNLKQFWIIFYEMSEEYEMFRMTDVRRIS